MSAHKGQKPFSKIVAIEMKKSYFSLRSGGTDYVITSRSGFLKLFPTYKKQLKAYCRKERLDFKEDGGVWAMTRLTEYIDSLIHGK